MKGLLMKDWLVLWRKNKMMIFILVSYVILSSFFDGYFFSTFAFAFTGMLAVTTMTFDEQSKWEQYAITMPYSRRDLVFSKFVFIIIALAIMALLSLLFWIISAVVQGEAVNMKEYLELLMIFVSIGLILPAINLPIAMKLGVEKGRFVTIITTVLVATLGNDPQIMSYSFLPSLTRINAVVLPILAFVLLGVSAFISLKVYERREL